jgi:hypothetical protein
VRRPVLSFRTSAAAGGAETGYDVEQQVRELLALHRPDLFAELEFDSYAESFLAYAPTEAAAQALATEVVKHSEK